jgi:3-dehydroquinate synthase II/3-amino-4-hydroxybenzoic acid synthase
MPKRPIWYDGRDLKDEGKILPLIYNLRYEYVLVRPETYQQAKAPRKIKFIVDVDGKEADFKAFPKDVIIYSHQLDVLRKAGKKGYKTAIHKRIENQETMDLAWQEGEQADFLVAELTSDTNIPLELLIAKLQSKDTVLLKQVSTQQEAEIAFGVMEAGSDGALLKTENIDELTKMDQFMHKEELGKIELVKAKVVNVQHIGMGYRACIDTTDIMKTNEGMIVGSTANGGLVLSSETHFLPYMDLRPFRVNAGAVHSYIWAPGDKTAYITELEGGKKVLVVDTDGNTREVTVGRVKTEIRPLLKVEAEVNGIRVNAMVQDDWHIRIFGGEGQPLNASQIKEGDELLVYLSPGARHVGIKIDELLQEK